MLLNLGGQLAFQTDSLVIGAVLGVREVSYYAIGNSLAQYLMKFVIAVSMVVMPTATRLHAQGRETELKAVLLKWTKISFFLTVVATTFLLVLGPSFIGWWIGPEFERPTGEVLRILALAHLVFLPIRAVSFPILMGIGKPKAPAIAFLVTGVVNLGMSIVLGRYMGLNGIALGTAIPNVFFAAYVLVLACRYTGTSLRECIGYVVPRSLIGAVPAALLLLWLKSDTNMHSFWALAGSGMAMLALFGVSALMFVYQEDPYVNFRRVWQGRRLQGERGA
jgi:O-antigen/teichoic acid export membrane protein